MLSQAQQNKIVNMLQKEGFIIVKPWLPNAVKVSSQLNGKSFTCDIVSENTDTGPVLYIDPLPLTCEVNLYPFENKSQYAKLTLLLSKLNVLFNK